MKTSDFYFALPKDLIAQTPIEPRDHSRLLVCNRADGSIGHRHFYDIVDYLHPKDVLVLNQTRVIPARLLGKRAQSGGAVECLLLKRLSGDCWETLVKPGKKMQIGQEIDFGDGELHGIVMDKTEAGGRIIRFLYDGVFEEILDRFGNMPLPPYITQHLEDQTRYQTVYATQEGSAAAPTAGLHFTQDLLEKIRAKGIDIVPILLHVGLGTFRPVKTQEIHEHVMHEEYYEVSPEAADRINAARASGGRIVCVGTTTVRTLESVADESGSIQAGSGQTKIFLSPGVHFRAVDALITNFHLPESTLLMLVSAFMGQPQALHAYQIAVEQAYRFFSFGDAMMIV